MRRHAKVKREIDQSPLNKLCDELQVRAELPAIEELRLGGGAAVDAIGGLRLYTAVYPCKVEGCGGIYTTTGSLSSHYMNDHKGVERGDLKGWPTIHAQRLSFASGFQQLFHVNPPPTPLLTQLPLLSESESDSQMRPQPKPFRSAGLSWFKEMQEEVEGITRKHQLDSADPRDVSCWMTRTQWQAHVAGHEGDFLRSLVAAPKKGEFPQLRETVTKIFQEAVGFITKTPHLILQKLHTKDPMKGWVILSLTLSPTQLICLYAPLILTSLSAILMAALTFLLLSGYLTDPFQHIRTVKHLGSMLWSQPSSLHSCCGTGEITSFLCQHPQRSSLTGSGL